MIRSFIKKYSKKYMCNNNNCKHITNRPKRIDSFGDCELMFCPKCGSVSARIK